MAHYPAHENLYPYFDRFFVGNCREKTVISKDEPIFRLLVMTGTPEKFLYALDVVHHEYQGHISGADQFEEAGLAIEPVTPDPRHLIFGKQRGQRDQFARKLNGDMEFRKKYLNRTILTGENDINTTIDGTSLTKTRVQKKNDLVPAEYGLLIRASLKYLLAKSNNLLTKHDPSWAKLTSDMRVLREFDARVDSLFVPGTTYIMPIDFQSIDAFEVLKIDAPGGRAARVTQTGPSIAVLHKSFAHVGFAVDQDGHMSEFDTAVEHYIKWTTDSYEKNKYRLDRCPLGIYWSTLFHSMVVRGMDVMMSVVGHDENGVSLREKYLATLYQSFLVDAAAQRQAWDEFEGPQGSLERLQNGFHPDSFALAIDEYKKLPDRPSDQILFITCRPGQAPVYEWEKRPRSLQ
jgi:hypothetical protein